MIIKAIQKNRDTNGQVISTKQFEIVINSFEFQKIEKVINKEDGKQTYIFANIFINGKVDLKERDIIVYNSKEYEIISVKEFINSFEIVEYTRIEI